MIIIDNYSQGLAIKPSTLEGAGIGIFTNIDIPFGIPVCEYKGKIVDPNEIVLDTRYLLNLSTGQILDANPNIPGLEIGLAGFINDRWNATNRPTVDLDAMPFEKARQTEVKLGYNVTFWEVPGENKHLLLSIRKIKAGEELFVNYGDDYWEGRTDD